jgi:hypothetical protein
MTTRDWPGWSAMAIALAGAAVLTATDAGADATAREQRAIGRVDSVALDAPAELRVTQGAAETLAVEAEARLLPLLRTRVEAGMLRIDLAGSVRTRTPLRVHLTLRTLQRLQSDGAGDVRIGPMRTPRLSIELGGSSSAQVASLDADRLDLALTGSSQLQIGRGTARQLRARIDEAAAFDAPDLRTAQAQLQMAGSAQARMHATQHLDAVLSESASLRYSGSPRVTRQTNGAAELLREPGQTP